MNYKSDTDKEGCKKLFRFGENIGIP